MKLQYDKAHILFKLDKAAQLGKRYPKAGNVVKDTLRPKKDSLCPFFRSPT